MVWWGEWGRVEWCRWQYWWGEPIDSHGQSVKLPALTSKLSTGQEGNLVLYKEKMWGKEFCSYFGIISIPNIDSKYNGNYKLSE